MPLCLSKGPPVPVRRSLGFESAASESPESVRRGGLPQLRRRVSRELHGIELFDARVQLSGEAEAEARQAAADRAAVAHAAEGAVQAVMARAEAEEAARTHIASLQAAAPDPFPQRSFSPAEPRPPLAEAVAAAWSPTSSPEASRAEVVGAQKRWLDANDAGQLKVEWGDDMESALLLQAAAIRQEAGATAAAKLLQIEAERVALEQQLAKVRAEAWAAKGEAAVMEMQLAKAKKDGISVETNGVSVETIGHMQMQRQRL